MGLILRDGLSVFGGGGVSDEVKDKDKQSTRCRW